jgi:hypothetical protein
MLACPPHIGVTLARCVGIMAVNPHVFAITTFRNILMRPKPLTLHKADFDSQNCKRGEQ